MMKIARDKSKKETKGWWQEVESAASRIRRKTRSEGAAIKSHYLIGLEKVTGAPDRKKPSSGNSTRNK